MSHLPDDLASWPLAPGQVLNVSTSADKAEIRRAYATLIRRFRPETHPAHFQRLREAMEILLAELQRGASPVSGGLDLAPVVLQAQEDDHKPPKTGGAKRPEKGESAAAPFNDRAPYEGKSPEGAEQLWEEYSRSPSAAVVQRIYSLAVSLRDDVTPFLMGYWTSKLTPTLCPDLSPMRWLSDGLERFGGDAELVRLLVAELRSQPDLLDSRNSGHLSERILNSANLQVYLSERWQLLAAKGDWKQLEQESEEARRRLAFSHPSVWFHLLSRVYELGILAEHSDGRFLAKKLFDEMEAMSGRSNGDQALEYVETLRFIAKCFEEQDPSSSAELNVLIADGPAVSNLEFQRRLQRLAYGYINNPAGLMNLLTELLVILPEALWMLTLNPESWLEMTHDPLQSDETIVKTVGHFLHLCGKLEYPIFRQEVVTFCRNECLSGTTFLAACRQWLETDKKERGGELVMSVARDLPVLLTCEWIAVFLQRSGPPS